MTPKIFGKDEWKIYIIGKLEKLEIPDQLKTGDKFTSQK